MLRLVVVILAVLLIKMFAFDTYPVKEQSMWPTLEGDVDRVGVDKIAALVGKLDRFDLWVFRRKDQFFVKRLLGLPGEVVDFRGGDFFIGQGGQDPSRVERPAWLVEQQMIRVPPDPTQNHVFEVKDGIAVEQTGGAFSLEPIPGRTLVASVVGGPGIDPLCIRDDHRDSRGRWARGRNAVPDVRITLGQLRRESAAFAIVHELGNGEYRRVVVDGTGLAIAARIGGVDSVRAEFPGVTCENGLRMETIDGVFRVLLKGGGGWRELFSELRDTDVPEGFSGVRFEVTGAGLHADSLEVARDVHYVWPPGQPKVPQPIPSDRLFLVGDNPAISTDSRDPEVGSVPRADLVGLVRAVVWPWGRKRIPR